MGKESQVLERDLPPGIARATILMLIALSAALALLSFLVPFPELVDAPFTLVPKNGADPVQVPIGGTLETVEAAVGKDVKAGDVLFVINSQDLAVMDTRVKNLERELENAQPISAAAHESRQAALHSAAVRVTSLNGELAFMLKRKKDAEKLRHIAEEAFKKNLISQEQLLREQDADDEAGRALENLRRGLAGATSAVAELKATQERETVELAATRSRLEGQLKEAEAALAWVKQATQEGKGAIEQGGQRLFQVLAPFEGTVTSIGPSRPGVVIERGEVLCTLAQSGAELHAELTVPELDAGRIAKEQSVKLLLDAYPYVRYGTKPAVVTWVSPTAENGKVPTHAALEDLTIVIDGIARPLRAGMGGKGRVRVGNRTLVEYLLEPLRQIEESLSHESK